MTERNIITGTTTAFLAPFVDGWHTLLVWFIVAVVLIIADLRFGIAAAKKRGETIRGSRAVRRTINKFVDYICWISISWVLGAAFGGPLEVPLLAVFIMALVCLIELSSIVDNYCELRGLKKRFNVIKFVSKIFKRSEIEECFEDTDKAQNED